jgi:hypothetical protein
MHGDSTCTGFAQKTEFDRKSKLTNKLRDFPSLLERGWGMAFFQFHLPPNEKRT